MLDEEAQQGPPDQAEPEEQEEEMDPYTRALRESMMKLPKEEQGIGMFIYATLHFSDFTLHVSLL
jgi:hypothetical protein